MAAIFSGEMQESVCPALQARTAGSKSHPRGSESSVGDSVFCVAALHQSVHENLAIIVREQLIRLRLA